MPTDLDRIRTTISLPRHVHDEFVRMASLSGVSVSRTMGDWLADTVDAAQFMNAKMAEAKKAPARVLREMTAMSRGLFESVSDFADEQRAKGRADRSAAHTQAGARGRGRAGGASIPPSSNTGGNEPTQLSPDGGK